MVKTMVRPHGKLTLEHLCCQDLRPLWGPALESVPAGHVVGVCAGAVHEELLVMGRTRVGEVHGALSPVGEAPHGSMEQCESSA